MRPNYVKPNTQTLLFSEPLNAKATKRESFPLPFWSHASNSLLHLDSENFLSPNLITLTALNSNSKFKIQIFKFNLSLFLSSSPSANSIPHSLFFTVSSIPFHGFYILKSEINTAVDFNCFRYTYNNHMPNAILN